MRTELMCMILRALKDGPKGVRAIQRWIAQNYNHKMSFSTLRGYLRRMKELGFVERYEGACPVCGRKLPYPLWGITVLGSLWLDFPSEVG